MENFVAVENDELGSAIKKGDTVIRGDLKGVVQYGKDGTTGKESNMLGFVSIDGCQYLVSIKDQLVFGWIKPTKPDFNTWIEDAFKQGYTLGLNQGWAIEQDSSGPMDFDKAVAKFKAGLE